MGSQSGEEEACAEASMGCRYPQRNCDVTEVSAQAAAKSRGRRSAGYVTPNSGTLVTSPMPVMKDTVDLSMLAADEQGRVRAVLQRAQESDKKMSQYCRSLKEEQLKMLRKTASAHPGLCPLCVTSLASSSKVCCACSQEYCSSCVHALSIPGRAQSASICSLCFVKRRVILSSSEWRDDAEVVVDIDDGKSTLGYGMVLVCGLKSDGGVRRTFVVDVPAGGEASSAGLTPGDEILSWCNQSLINLPFRKVHAIVLSSYLQAASVTFRHYQQNGERTDRSTTLHAAEEDLSTASDVVQRMLADPDAIAFRDGLNQDTGANRVPNYLHGRIKLKLCFNTGVLKVTAVEADGLPCPKPSVSPSPVVVVDFDGKKALSTTACLKTRHPVWNEELTFTVPHKKTAGFKLRIAVKTKQIVGKATLCQCCIDLDEAVLDNSPQWYCLQPPVIVSTSTVQMQSPSGSLSRLMLASHRHKLQTEARRNSPSGSSSSPKHHRNQRTSKSRSPPTIPSPGQDTGSRHLSVSRGTDSPDGRRRGRSLSPPNHPRRLSSLPQHMTKRKLFRPFRSFSVDKGILPSRAGSQRSSSISSIFRSARNSSPSPPGLTGSRDHDFLDRGRRQAFGSDRSLASDRPIPAVVVDQDNSDGEDVFLSDGSTGQEHGSAELPQNLSGSVSSQLDTLSVASNETAGSSDMSGSNTSLSLYTDSTSQNSSILLLLLRRGEELSVIVSGVDHITDLVEEAEMKLPDIKSMAVKICLSVDSKVMLKLKTKSQPVTAMPSFEDPLLFKLSFKTRNYVLLATVVCKVKSRFGVRRKSFPLGSAKLPFSDADFKEGIPQISTLKLCTRCRK